MHDEETKGHCNREYHHLRVDSTTLVEDRKEKCLQHQCKGNSRASTDQSNQNNYAKNEFFRDRHEYGS
jgi:uncharacterized iron-regulated protein